jgi:hypothetical protein
VAPPRNLSFRYGQRPTIHRLQRCRGPRGPRASVAVAHALRAGRHRACRRLAARPPKASGGTPEGAPNSAWMGSWPAGRRGAPTTRTARPQRATTPGTGTGTGLAGTPGHQTQRGDHTGREKTGDVGEEGPETLAPTHTHRPQFGPNFVCDRKRYQKCLAGKGFSMEVVRARVKSPYKVGHLRAPITDTSGLGEIRSTGARDLTGTLGCPAPWPSPRPATVPGGGRALPGHPPGQRPSRGICPSPGRRRGLPSLSPPNPEISMGHSMAIQPPCGSIDVGEEIYNTCGTLGDRMAL